MCVRLFVIYWIDFRSESVQSVLSSHGSECIVLVVLMQSRLVSGKETFVENYLSQIALSPIYNFFLKCTVGVFFSRVKEINSGDLFIEYVTRRVLTHVLDQGRITLLVKSEC